MHLSPLSLNIQPVLADYDHTLRLYPLPTVVRVYVADMCPEPDIRPRDSLS